MGLPTGHREPSPSLTAFQKEGLKPKLFLMFDGASCGGRFQNGAGQQAAAAGPARHPQDVSQECFTGV